MTNKTSNNPYLYTFSDILGDSISEEQALEAIKKDSASFIKFQNFPQEEKDSLLSFLMGKKGLSITYDSFFRSIMSPELYPERLEHFLSAILNQEIHIQSVLTRDGSQLAEHGTFVIMDIIVMLSNGSTHNVEIQKIGYLFSGERSSCYISDMVMRQYNRVKSERGKNFSFKDMKPVYLIILMENSPDAFKKVSPNYIHREVTTFSSGAQVPLLSNIIYISLDTFHSVVHNIDTDLDAWLTFLSSTNSKQIVQLVNHYPEFLTYYKNILEFRRNPKELIYMFSEALAILDRNTEKLMYDEIHKDLENAKKELDSTKKTLDSTKKLLIIPKKLLIIQKNLLIIPRNLLIVKIKNLKVQRTKLNA